MIYYIRKNKIRQAFCLKRRKVLLLWVTFFDKTKFFPKNIQHNRIYSQEEFLFVVKRKLRTSFTHSPILSYAVSRRISRRKGNLEIIAARKSIRVQHLSAKAQSLYLFRFHCARIDLGQIHSAGSNDRFAEIP